MVGRFFNLNACRSLDVLLFFCMYHNVTLYRLIFLCIHIHTHTHTLKYMYLYALLPVYVYISLVWTRGFPGDSVVKNLPAIPETWAWSLGQEDFLEKEMATYSSILGWEVPWTEKRGGLLSMGLQRVWHNLMAKQQQMWTLLMMNMFEHSLCITWFYP